MSKDNENNQQENLFEKYYLQQNNETNKTKSSSKSSTPQNLTSSQMSANNDINVESSNYFSKCFSNSVIPYLSLKDLINLKKCSKLLNIIVNPKSIKICIISNSINNFPSKENRISIWKHYMSYDNFTSTLLSKYLVTDEKEEKNKEEIYYK